MHGVAFGGAGRGGGAHGEGGARAASGAEAVQLDAVLAVALAAGDDDGAGGRGPLPQSFDVGGEPGRAPSGPLGRGGDDGPGGVVQGGPPVDLAGERGEQSLGAGAERLPGQLALGGEAGGDGAVLVGGYGRGDGLADGEEGVRRGTSRSGSPASRAASTRASGMSS